MNDKPAIFSYAQPEENSGYLLWQVSMSWQLRMNQQLSTVGLTLTQFSLLAGLHWLTQQGEVVTQQRLADYAHTDKMMTSKVLQTLERKRLITRTNHPQDSRAKHLLLTDEGYMQLSRANQVVEQVDTAFFGPIQDNKEAFNELMLRLMKSSG